MFVDENVFFEHLSKRLGNSRAHAPWVPFLERVPQQVADTMIANRIDTLITELDKLGARAVVVHSLADLHQELENIITSESLLEMISWDAATLQAYEVGDIVNRAKQRAKQQVRDVSSQTVIVGITACDYAVASTGSLVIVSGAGRGRAASLLPDVHIVLMKAGQIRNSMGEVLTELNAAYAGQDLPSAIQFISGASRSSDIENDLSIGVHGPGAVIVLILE
jgi:L-lactate dehydrogenase complex protein LldG